MVMVREVGVGWDMVWMVVDVGAGQTSIVGWAQWVRTDTLEERRGELEAHYRALREIGQTI